MVTFMAFSVSVPVLSEQRTLMEPSVSTVDKLLHKTFCFFIARAMIVKLIVTAIGRPTSISKVLQNNKIVSTFRNKSNADGDDRYNHS